MPHLKPNCSVEYTFTDIPAELPKINSEKQTMHQWCDFGPGLSVRLTTGRL